MYQEKMSRENKRKGIIITIDQVETDCDYFASCFYCKAD
jgi:hypothetical protein